MPNNWKKYKLGDIANIVMGQSPKSEFYNNDKIGLPFLQGNRTFGRLYPTFDTYTTDAKKIAEKGSVLFSVRAPVGDINIATDRICIGRGLCSFQLKKGDNLYLLYLLKHYKNTIVNQESGTVFGSVNKDILSSIEVYFPENDHEQKSIASILSAIDDKIENNLAINKTLEEMAMALYKHWFVDFGPFQDGEFVESELGRIPKGWEVLSLDDVSTLTAGGDKPRNFSNTKTDECKIPIYSNGITNDGLYGFTDSARINEESITVSARGTIGFVCLRLEPYLPIVRLIAVVPKQDFVTSKYLFYWLKTQNINGNGTTQQQLTVPDFKVTKVLVPKFEIINKFTDIINPYYDEINSNIKENQTLTQLRDTLLPKLISGEVRLKEFQES